MTRRSRIVVLVLAASLTTIAIASAAAIMFRPLAVFESFERVRLRMAGMRRVEATAPRGPVTYWRGGGDGSAVVFLHGVNDQAGTWVRVIGSLGERHRLLLLDLAGHGASAPADGPLSVKDLLDGIEAVVAAEARADRIALVGNSLGGWLALLYADRHPERVRQVVLVNGAAIRDDGSAAVNLLPRNRQEAAQALQATMSPSSPPVPAFVMDDLVRRAPASPLARLMATPVAGEYLIDSRLGSLRVPVTLIWGEDDRVLPVTYAQKVAAALPSADLQRLPRCGHIPQRECPEQLMPALQRALGSPTGR